MEVTIDPIGVALLIEGRIGTKVRMQWKKMLTDAKRLWMLILNDESTFIVYQKWWCDNSVLGSKGSCEGSPKIRG